MPSKFTFNRRAWIDFGVTLGLLGVAFLLAFLSSALSRAGDWATGAAAAIGALILAIVGGLYIVPKLARRVRWELMGFGLRTAITTEGMIFSTLVVVIGVAAWNTENNLLYLVLAALLAFIIASGNVARLTLHDLAVQLRTPDHLYAGEPANLTVTLVNKKLIIPSCSVLVEAVLRRDGDPEPRRRRRRSKNRDGVKLAHFVIVPPRSQVRQTIAYTFARRGQYRIRTFRLETRFPSGFFRKWRESEAQGEIVVFPATKPIDDFFNTLPILAGSAESHIRGDGVDLYAHRDYQPTDHLRRIDWKASAKARRVVVRDTVVDEDRRLSIYFDPSPPVSGDLDAFRERFETAIEMAASLARHFIVEQSDVELVTPRVRIPAGSGPGHLVKLLGELATLMPAVDDGDDGEQSLGSLEALPGLLDERRFKVLFTSAEKGSIPAIVWRTAHVVYVDDL